jgi:hypothetical protein
VDVAPINGVPVTGGFEVGSGVEVDGAGVKV